MKNKTMKELARLVVRRFGPETGGRIAADAGERWQALCLENRSACKAQQVHLTGNLQIGRAHV